MTIEFDGTDDPSGLEVYDPIEQRRLHVRTPESVVPSPGDPDRFRFPVDAVCSIAASSLVFDQRYYVHVHGPGGEDKRGIEVGERRDIDAGPDGRSTVLELSGPLKLYCEFDAPASVDAGINGVRLSFDGPAPIEFGARSLHKRPAGTIRTPSDPASLLRAVSHLPSALKTTSPDRSWPTLRGHPPLIDVDDDLEELEIPDVCRPPETDVTIATPPTHRHLLTVAPLAFYLGARLETADAPRLETATGTHELGVDRSLEDDVARSLKRAFLLDCLVRTEGLNGEHVRERDALESALPFDLRETYEADLSTQLDRYLSVPYATVEPHVPRWPLTAHLPPTPSSVEVLPFVVNELGIVREPRGRTVAPESATSAVDVDVPPVAGPRARAAPERTVRSADANRAPRSPSDEDLETPTVVEPAITDESIEHAWFGDDLPRGASKATLEAYRSQLDRRARNESIEILVVCNDARMLEEHDVLDETYGTRETLPFDVDSEFGVSTAELEALLTAGGYDFLHYIGHATPEGLRCPDGKLDVRDLSSVDLGVFFLNACRSYEQGLALARRGAFGGIATVSDIDNEYAVEIGETIARLLNLGFPLRGALELVRETTTLGDQYLIVGDGSTDIAQSAGGVPTVARVTNERADGSRPDGTAFEAGLEIQFQSYPTKGLHVGTISKPAIESEMDCHLIPRTVTVPQVSKSAFEEHLLWTPTPIIRDGTFRWNDGFNIVDFS
ncbi:hypothetical protein ACFQGT_02230 [Natrialbaceae archaeon GCM10025810]|uniref:hypothetical protein n=1 Tax=Halovalidus salilacus TaxID=3075124 RepID=UPI00361D5C9D